jgi:3-dehydroquinate synthase
MNKKKFIFSSASVDFYFDALFSQLDKIVDRKKTILITDEHVFAAHKTKFRNWNVITLKPGEEYKIQPTADAIIEQLIGFQADRTSTIVGVGGGVVTDLTGYVASVFMRGIAFGFVPTSLLAMVDASIGGKNGIDVGQYKNMVGVIRQPSFIYFDQSFLKTLPAAEWSNGFAEIIKHASILDSRAFSLLESTTLEKVKKSKKLMQEIILGNVKLKAGVVKRDEFEAGDRKLLNFGHTLGHALETQYDLTHGQAVSLGMIFAAWLSEKLFGFKDLERLEQLLTNFGLPTRAAFDLDKVFNVLIMDKKRVSKTMNFVLLKKTGKGVIHAIDIDALKLHLAAFNGPNKKKK